MGEGLRGAMPAPEGQRAKTDNASWVPEMPFGTIPSDSSHNLREETSWNQDRNIWHHFGRTVSARDLGSQSNLQNKNKTKQKTNPPKSISERIFEFFVWSKALMNKCNTK